MDKELNAFLFKKADVYHQLTSAFAEAERHFWAQLGDILETLLANALRGAGADWTIKYKHEDRQCHAYRIKWMLDIRKATEEWEKAPAFWFPGVVPKTTILLGLEGSARVYAEIWGTPLSRHAENLETVKEMWNDQIAEPLIKKKKWIPFGERVTTPGGQWGLHLPITLDHGEVAKWIETDDLRRALAPLEKAVKDFASIVPAMDKLVEQVRKMKR